MNAPSTPQAQAYAGIYQATLQQAARSGGQIMVKLIAAARRDLKERLAQVRGLSERDYLEIAGVLLDKNAKHLAEEYPPALTDAFHRVDTGEVFAPSGLTNVQFDKLELMDSDQVDESVELARSQQTVLLAADVALNELNTYVSAALGLASVQADRNPLRPEVFVRTLQSLLSKLDIPTEVRKDWLRPMSVALGPELHVLYQVLSRQFRDSGISAVGYAVVRNSGGTSGAAAATQGDAAANADLSGDPQGIVPSTHAQQTALAGQQRQTVLTLDRLRRLLAGELQEGPVDLAAFSQQFSHQFDQASDRFGPVVEADFEVTVPAAFHVLQEMDQLDQVVQRIGLRQQLPATDIGLQPGSLPAVREQLRRSSSGVGQALSLEVVEMMVDNIARDPRLLDPVRHVIRNMEPALLRLALVDPRFFSDKQHPARRLLQEVTHRSLAFDAVDTAGFNGFLEPLHRLLGPLATQAIEGAEPFEQVLAELLGHWEASAHRDGLDQAVKVLEHAEQRSLLAEKAAEWIASMPDTARVPVAVQDFLRGPWSQVIAQARLADQTGDADPGKYRELVAALLWSAQPEITRRNIAKLTRLVSNLLGKLREGLALIEYPSVKTSEFFEVLMKLHQQAFRPVSEKLDSPPTEGLRSSLLGPDEPWLAPSEAKLSGFMELSDAIAQLPAASKTAKSAEIRAADAPVTGELTPQALADAVLSLNVGSWVEVRINTSWIRSQLSWASPQGTLFLFTNAYGQTQSMTKRSRDRMLATGAMRVVSAAPMVDGALDAVAQSALMNSMFLKQ